VLNSAQSTNQASGAAWWVNGLALPRGNAVGGGGDLARPGHARDKAKLASWAARSDPVRLAGPKRKEKEIWAGWIGPYRFLNTRKGFSF
jgi:hypothetical protein